MAVSEIIRNVYSFAKILAQAGTEVVRHWDIKSLENAFNWARYCEKVLNRVKRKGAFLLSS